MYNKKPHDVSWSGGKRSKVTEQYPSKAICSFFGSKQNLLTEAKGQGLSLIAYLSAI